MTEGPKSVSEEWRRLLSSLTVAQKCLFLTTGCAILSELTESISEKQYELDKSSHGSLWTLRYQIDQLRAWLTLFLS